LKPARSGTPAEDHDRLAIVQVTLLGPVAAAAEGTELPLGGLKQRAVFALLALNAGRVVALDRLVDELWEGEPPSRATLSLQSYVARLRRVLAGLTLSQGEAPRIVTRPPGWVLTLDPHLVDVNRFDALVVAARRALQAGDPGTASQQLQEGLELWTGEPLAGLEAVRFAREEAARLNELRLAATELLMRAQLDRGETDLVTERASRFVATHPFRERGWTAYMLALYRSGRQSEALAAAAQLRRLLATELGVDPSPEVRGLEEQILRQDAALLTSGSEVTARSFEPPPATAAAEPDADARLFGRDSALSAVEDAVGRAAAGTGQLLVLHAPAGLGKSSILQRVEVRVRDGGGVVLRGDCVGAGAAPALWPWVTIARGLVGANTETKQETKQEAKHETKPDDTARGALAVLLAETPMVNAAGAVADAAGSRMVLFRAVIDALAVERARRPVAVLMDDLQWADADTLTLLSLAVDELAARGVLFVVAVRSDEPGADTVLGMVDRLRRSNVQRIGLAPLEPIDVGALVRDLSGVDAASEVVSAVHSRTAGNPLFIRELVLLLSSERRLDAEGVRSTLPREVREVLRHRIARLPEQTVAMLAVIAVSGGPTSVDVLADVTGLDLDAVLDACEAAELAGLLLDDAQHPGSFALSHDLVRQTLEQSLSTARRLRLHARIADVLQAREPMTSREIVDVARHLTLAAPLVGPHRAVPHLLAASDDALSRFANDQAEAHLRTALELIAQVRDPAQRAGLEGPVRGRLTFLQLTLRGAGEEPPGQAGPVPPTDLAHPTDTESAMGWLGVMIRATLTGQARWTAPAAEAVLAAGPPPDTRFCAHFVQGFASHMTGRIAVARREFEAMEVLIQQGVHVQIPGFFVGDAVTPAHAALLAHIEGDDARADDLMATALMRSGDSAAALVTVVQHQCWLAVMRGDAERGREHSTRCRALAQQLDVTLYGLVADLVQGWADAVLGDPTGVARGATAFDVYGATGLHLFEPLYLLLLAEAEAASGADGRAADLIRRSRAVEAVTGEVCSSPRLLAWAAARLPEVA
jgi:DNA-binding SARP family transcriptional activator